MAERSAFFPNCDTKILSPRRKFPMIMCPLLSRAPVRRLPTSLPFHRNADPTRWQYRSFGFMRKRLTLALQECSDLYRSYLVICTFAANFFLAPSEFCLARRLPTEARSGKVQPTPALQPSFSPPPDYRRSECSSDLLINPLPFLQVALPDLR